MREMKMSTQIHLNADDDDDYNEVGDGSDEGDGDDGDEDHVSDGGADDSDGANAGYDHAAHQRLTDPCRLLV
eukprot:4931100-Pyramimonas_sp.AAC.1